MQKSVHSCQRMHLRHKLKWWHVLNRCSSTQRILCLWHRCTKMVKCAESDKCKPLHLDATMTVIISKVIRWRLKKSLSGSRLSEGIWLIDWSTAPVLILTTQLYKRDWNRKSSVSQWVPWIIQPLTSSLCWVSFIQSDFRRRQTRQFGHNLRWRRASFLPSWCSVISCLTATAHAKFTKPLNT